MVSGITNPPITINTTLPSTDSLLRDRGSSSSRSTSAIIFTPIDEDSASASDPLLRPRGEDKMDASGPGSWSGPGLPLPLPAGESSRSIRRVRSQERTKSWIEQRARDQQSLGQDEMGFLKPPTGESSRRSSIVSDTEALDEPFELGTTSKHSSWSSRRSSHRLVHRIRRTSDALSASVSSPDKDSDSDEDILNLTSAELGRRIIAKERADREKKYLARERRLSGRRELEREIEEGPISRPISVVSVPSKPKEAIVSIAELVDRHKEAMARPTTAFKAKARKELGIKCTPPPVNVLTPTSSNQSGTTPRPRLRGETPTIPARTSSTPDVKVGVVPPRSSSRSDIASLSLVRSNSATGTWNESISTGTGSESVIQNALLNQAALEQLELDDQQRPTSPCSRKVSFQTFRDSPSRLRKERRSTTPSRTGRATPSLSIKEDDEEQALAVALYLRSPNLNRYFSFPRPHPEPALRVSVAEVGSLKGSPVLLFLGLGCVRYLTALFDDLAKALDLRLICIDRWGYGKTDMVDESKRGLREWAAIVERVMDEMKIKRFSVLAHSAGCPYALAAANRMKERVVGKIHLLAPWVGTDVDNSYKWLKWVPNGIIKSATAAEWRLQSYFLGKPPPLTYSPIGYNATPASSSTYLPFASGRNASVLSISGNPNAVPRKPSLLHRASNMVLRTKNINTIPEPEYVNVAELTAVESGTLPLLPLGTKHWKGIASTAVKGGKGSDNLQLPDQAGSRTPWGKQSNHSSLSLHRSPSATPGPLDFGLSEGFDSFPDGIAPPPLGSSKRKGFTAYSYSYSYSYSRSPTSATKIKPPSASTSNRPPSPAPPTGPSFGVALQQASHAECEPGTTSDLLSIVLGRQHANRPWQYALNYADFSLPVKIYWGQDDDKIREKSVRWMEKTMTAGVELLVLQGEGHNLMTSSGTMLSVFQSLAEEVAVAAKLPQPDLRYY